MLEAAGLFEQISTQRDDKSRNISYFCLTLPGWRITSHSMRTLREQFRRKIRQAKQAMRRFARAVMRPVRICLSRVQGGVGIPRRPAVVDLCAPVVPATLLLSSRARRSGQLGRWLHAGMRVFARNVLAVTPRLECLGVHQSACKAKHTNWKWSQLSDLGPVNRAAREAPLNS